jgi:hypothetical protein
MKLEFRAHNTVPGLPFTAESDHERLFEHLIQDFGELGPLMTWASSGESTVVVLATDADDESQAAGEMIAAVAVSLHRSGLGHLYPAAIGIELAEEELATA